MDNALLSKTAAAMVAQGQRHPRRRRVAPAPARRASSRSMSNAPRRTAAPTAACSSPRPGIEQYLSGVILFDETLRQKTNDGMPFGDYLAKKGIIPGIKVDAGAKDLPLAPGEKVTEGLDGLPKRLDGVLQARRALRQVARRDHHRQEHPDAHLHLRQRACAGALRRRLPGSLDRADDRARSAARRRPHRRALRGSARGDAARHLRRAAPPTTSRSST